MATVASLLYLLRELGRDKSTVSAVRRRKALVFRRVLVLIWCSAVCTLHSLYSILDETREEEGGCPES